MKKLIYKNGTYYISDDENDSRGQTRIISYKANSKDMPHKQFNDYVVVYGRNTCPYCIKTIDLLKSYPNALFVEIDTEPNELFSKSKLLNILKPDIQNHTTVPIIFDKGTFLGGASEAETYFV